eukprot:315298-Prymnesium_polylepis.1
MVSPLSKYGTGLLPRIPTSIGNILEDTCRPELKSPASVGKIDLWSSELLKKSCCSTPAGEEGYQRARVRDGPAEPAQQRALDETQTRKRTHNAVKVFAWCVPRRTIAPAAVTVRAVRRQSRRPSMSMSMCGSIEPDRGSTLKSTP